MNIYKYDSNFKLFDLLTKILKFVFNRLSGFNKYRIFDFIIDELNNWESGKLENIEVIFREKEVSKISMFDYLVNASEEMYL